MTTSTDITERIHQGIAHRDQVIAHVLTGQLQIDDLAQASAAAPNEPASLDIHAALAATAYATGNKKLCMKALHRNWNILGPGQIHPLTQIIADIYLDGLPPADIRQVITHADH